MKNKMSMGFLLSGDVGSSGGGGAQKPETKTETKTEIKTPPTPAEVKPATPVAAPDPAPAARPRIAFSSLSARERLIVCRVARNQEGGGALPLDVRRAVLSDYEGIPENAFAPDPVGPGWAEKMAEGAEKALMIVIGMAAGAMGLLLLVETTKAILRATGALPPAVSPAALPTVVAPDEVGIAQ